jgi:hypothetical protein
MTKKRVLGIASTRAIVAVAVAPVLLMTAGIANAQDSGDRMLGCREASSDEDRSKLALLRSYTLTSIAVSANNRLCKVHDRISSWLAKEEPEMLSMEQLTDAAKPDAQKALEALERKKADQAMMQRVEARRWWEANKGRFTNAADEAVREHNERTEREALEKSWAPNPPPAGADTAAVLTDDAPAVIWRDKRGGFINIFKGNGPADPQSATVETGDEINGEGTLINDKGIQRGTFENGKLEGAGEAISNDGSWAVGTFDNGEMEGQGIVIAEDADGQVAVTEARFRDGAPDGLAETTFENGSSRRDIWAEGKKVATGAIAAAGKMPETPEYKSPAQLAAEAEKAFLAALDTETNPGELFVMADGFAEDGDLAKARQAWRALVRRFPNSPLAAQAAARLGNSGASGAGSGNCGGTNCSSATATPAPAPRPVRARYSSVCLRDFAYLQQRITESNISFKFTTGFYDALLTMVDRCAAYDPKAAEEVRIKRGERASLDTRYQENDPNLGILRNEVRRALSDPNYSSSLGPYRLGPGGVSDDGSPPQSATGGGASGAGYVTALADAILPASIMGRFTGKGMPIATCDEQMAANSSIVPRTASGTIPDQMRQAMAAAELGIVIYRQCEGDPAAEGKIAYYRQLRSTSLDGCRGLSSNPGYCLTPWRP